MTTQTSGRADAPPLDFLQPPSDIYTSAVKLAKQYLDALASEVSGVQEARLPQLSWPDASGRVGSNSHKRKRGQSGSPAAAAAAARKADLLRIKKIHTDGFGAEQIWEQARRVINAAAGECERELEQFGLLSLGNGESVLEGGDTTGEEEEDDDDEVSEGNAEFSDSVQGGDSDGIEGEESDNSADDNDPFLADSDCDGDIAHHSEDDGSAAFQEDEDSDDSDSGEGMAKDVHGLNDGFFSIDEFNKQTQMLERQDAKRGGDSDDDDDDDDVNWDADPFSESIVRAPLGKSKGGKKKKDDEEEEESDSESDDEDGPTFGNMDLNAPEGASDMEDEDEDENGDVEDDGKNANSLMYADFFEAPKKSTRKNKKGRPHPHNFPAKVAEDDDDVEMEDLDETMGERDVERAIAAVKNDIFNLYDDESDDEEEAGRKVKSTHERRQAQLLNEIRQLEAEAVSKRHWTLQGEAKAKDRPINSLLEEDVDFERAGKPLPVVTPEISEDIEALIKRRILNREFDEVIRRRPDEILASSNVRRGKLEGVDDRKSGKSLAELYEDDHRRRTDPNYVDELSEAQRAQHVELDNLWKSISADLDSLSNWHYRPKAAAPNLEIRVDAAAITMEDARPAGVEGLAESAGAATAGTSMLAPQEIYKVGQDVVKGSGETVTRGGMPVAVAEMDRDDKKRRRRREKERARKANGNKPSLKDDTSKKGAKKQVIENLKRANVKVIGKKGELRGVDGQEVSEKAGRGSVGGAAQLKL